jgi:dienelactone hydrolase
VKHAVLTLVLLVPLYLGAAGQEVRFPGPDIELVGRLYVAEGKPQAPAVVLLHGCSGMWTRTGQPIRSYEAWAQHLQKRGFTALLLDSFGPRGEKEICTQKERRVEPRRDRAADAYAALRWFAERPDVDPGRIHVLGWSNGGTTVLQALRTEAPGRTPEGPRFRSGVAFYPGCGPLSRIAYKPAEPLLIQAGAADDWTPAGDCVKLAARAKAQGASVEIDVYDDAHHSFDRIEGRIRHRPDVRNPSAPTGWGATVGPNPKAREKSMARTTAFLEAAR